MNLDYKLLAKLAREAEAETEKEALLLEPKVLGMRGGCHVVATILKEIFPHYRIVGVVHDDMPPHVGCASCSQFIDLDGIHPLPPGAIDCEPVSPNNPLFRGYLMKPDFVAKARSRLEPYIRSRLENYTVRAPEPS